MVLSLRVQGMRYKEGILRVYLFPPHSTSMAVDKMIAGASGMATSCS